MMIVVELPSSSNSSSSSSRRPRTFGRIVVIVHLRSLVMIVDDAVVCACWNGWSSRWPIHGDNEDAIAIARCDLDCGLLG